MRARFEATPVSDMVKVHTSVAFSVDPASVIACARSLPCGINNPQAQALDASERIDDDLCWAREIADPWGNLDELNCYDDDQIRTELVENEALTPARKWPAELLSNELPPQR